MIYLEIFAAIATILTVVAAAWKWGEYRLSLARRISGLEHLLARKNQPGDESLTVSQIAVALGLTENQIIEAAGRSKKVRSWHGRSGQEHRYRLKRDKA